MARVKRGVTAHAKHKKVLEQAKGFYGRRKNTIRTAKAAVDKAGQYAYRDRKVRKRAFRSLWIQRINAGARTEGFTYSQFIHGLDVAGIVIDRKGVAVDADTTRTHIAAWVFSSGAWWIMLSMALAIVLAPIRLAWFLRKETRTAVRQSRIGRCHCPSCGYNAKHSILHGRCPECGRELYERPTY